ncbi:MAG: hypothetical protein ACXWC3_13105 [Burkholderiales bacterium]
MIETNVLREGESRGGDTPNTMIVSLITVLMAALTAPSCLPDGVNLNDLTPLHASGMQLPQISMGVREPSVRGLRHALDAYNAGTADRETVSSLKPFGRRAFHGRFSVLSENADFMGGQNLEIEFPRHPESVYFVWMYRYANGIWVVRRFMQMPCSERQLHWINTRYREELDSITA